MKSTLFSFAIVPLLIFIKCSDGSNAILFSTRDIDLPWRTVIASEKERGERLIVSGTVFAANGEIPLEGVKLYVYHTDVYGRYNNHSGSSSDPRLFAYLRTNREGRYEFETIKPGPYPTGGTPAHIHYVLSMPEAEEQRFEIFFEGDRFLSDATRARAERGEAMIMRPERGQDDILRGNCDITFHAQ
ncbi:MAG: hypothetical protein JSW67_15565 [Candidatus Latescibacterota bacterium]|nr:MAG: hypothetical protein JSW67_15565 [Candidatus Latescibacterota bacterium]